MGLALSSDEECSAEEGSGSGDGGDTSGGEEDVDAADLVADLQGQLKLLARQRRPPQKLDL